MTRVSILFTTILLFGQTLGSSMALAEAPADSAPLHQQIDRLFEADTLVPAIAQADDAEFLRRAMLDLHGIIPTAEEAREFLADLSPTKRTDLIDRLLASPRYARHFATTFDVLWLERKVEKNIRTQDWYDYLYQSFNDGKSYDRLVREVLAADDTPETRATLRFYFARTVEPHALTRDIGRLFFGMDMQCNQCHDSPIVDDYKIGDYYGLYAFVSRTSLYQDKKKVPSLAEKAEGEANFKSVFTGESSDKVVPKLPRGPAIEEPALKKGEEYAVKPAKDVKPVPKFSRRAALAERGVDGSTEMFDRNAVNRLWAHLMGRGLVHPLELHHSDNPPSHPVILDLLAREFREHGCDVRYILREIALTKTYARACELPSPKSLNAGVIAKRVAACQHELAELEKQTAENTDENESRRLRTLTNATRKSHEEAQIAAGYLQAVKSDAKQAAIQWERLIKFWEDRGDVVLLKPLSPESFSLSVLQATGAVDSAQDKVRVSFQAKKPKEWTDADPSERPRVEAMLVEKLTYNQFSKSMQPFINMYDDAPGAEFGANLNQALFFGNAGVVEGLLKPAPGNLTERLAALTDPHALTDELYFALFGRGPTKDDEAAVAAFLKDRSDRAAAIQEMTWSLMSSNEFRFNH